jgi:WD40 repeat protein
LLGHAGPVIAVVFSPNAKEIAAAGNDGTLRIWDLATSKERLVLDPHSGALASAAFSADGKVVAAAGADHVVRIWDAGSGRLVATLGGHTSPVTGLAFSPDGKQLASASEDRSVRIWDVASLFTSSGNESSRLTPRLVLKGHNGPVSGVAFKADGKLLASAGWDQTLKLWDTGTGKEVLTLKGHSHVVTDVVFLPNGRFLASSSNDGTVRIWDAAASVPGSAQTRLLRLDAPTGD